MSGTTMMSTLMKKRQREAIWVSSALVKTRARIQLVVNSGKSGGEFFDQRVESLRLIDKQRMTGLFEQLYFRRWSIFFEIRCLLLILRRHDVEQWLFEPTNNVSPMTPLKR